MYYEKQRRLAQIKIKKKWEKVNIKINRHLRDIIHGYIMSDGYVSMNGILNSGHSIKQKCFIEWLYKKLQPVRTTTPIRLTHNRHSKTKKIYSAYFFSTRSFLGGFRAMWYEKEPGPDKKYQKKLPNSIACFFNETFISVWFAGNGTKTVPYRGAKFEVTAFTVPDRLKLKDLFMKKFNIETKIISSGKSANGKDQWVLTIPAQEYSKFRKLITKNDLIPKCFAYKLHKK